MQGKTLVKPPDQLDLTEKVRELGEDLWSDPANIMSHHSDVGLLLMHVSVFCVHKELNEEITRVLTANNPNAPQNVVRYSFKVKFCCISTTF